MAESVKKLASKVVKSVKFHVDCNLAGRRSKFLSVGFTPTKEEIEKLLAIASRYGIEIKVPHHN